MVESVSDSFAYVAGPVHIHSVVRGTPLFTICCSEPYDLYNCRMPSCSNVVHCSLARVATTAVKVSGSSRCARSLAALCLSLYLYRECREAVPCRC